MKTMTMMSLTVALVLAACGPAGEAGDECTADDDCADGLECHFHDDDDHDGEEEEEEEHGECMDH